MTDLHKRRFTRVRVKWPVEMGDRQSSHRWDGQITEKTIKARFVEKENDLHWPGVRHRHLVYSVHRYEDEITGADGDILFVDRGRARATDYIEEFICVPMGVKTGGKAGWQLIQNDDTPLCTASGACLDQSG